jgi:hypothetical protein
MPHMEGEHELHGLRFWDGDPTVRVRQAADDLGAHASGALRARDGSAPFAGIRAGLGDFRTTAAPLAFANATESLSPFVGFDEVLDG